MYIHPHPLLKYSAVVLQPSEGQKSLKMLHACMLLSGLQENIYIYIYISFLHADRFLSAPARLRHESASRLDWIRMRCGSGHMLKDPHLSPPEADRDKWKESDENRAKSLGK